MTGPVRERLAVVRCGGRQGSGYLLTPRLVLTAAHIVDGNEHIRVAVPGTGQERPCSKAGSWYDPAAGLDVALLSSAHALNALRSDTPARWARTESLDPIPDCRAVGFPYVQRDGQGRLDTEQLIGTYKPGSGLFSGRDVLTVDGTPPAPRTDGVSPWAGMSGAAVFAGGALLGLITADPQGWQHGRVTVTRLHRLLAEPDFRTVLEDHQYPVLTTPLNETARFELRYSAYIAQRHGSLRMLGIDLTDRKRATWPLDAAYCSLEAAPRDVGEGDGRLRSAVPLSAGPVPAEQALAGHDRVLLRGVAGSGKTTLVQWLAVTAARQELGRYLHYLRDLVPYVLPLSTIARRERLPAPGEFLTAVEVPLTGPPGWTEKVLADGRALVMVDGLDEIDQRARERVGDWLRGLLAAFPGNHWLVTSRPSAVAEHWLADEGFAELTLSPMSRRDIDAFVERWHNAARRAAADDPEELHRLNGYQDGLLDALHTKPDLTRLATNPLMCSLICALHRDRNGYLPTGRKELYDAALSMLLIRRDRERDLAPQLTEAPQIQLLQKLAYWLVKNNQAEMDRSDAVSLVASALPSMPAAAALGGAAEVYQYLLERSGLLREPAAGAVDFIHRTFQDYLAARAAVEERDFDLMTRNAHRDQWSDVIRMAVAHARPDERARLLKKIISRGDRVRTHRARLHLLAMACLEHATELDQDVRSAVKDRAEQLIPPRSYREAEALAAAGAIVLELLPGPARLNHHEAASVVRTAIRIGGDAAVPVLRRFAAHANPESVRLLRNFLPNVDREEYAGEVLARLPRADTVYLARSEEELRVLSRMGGVERIELRGWVPVHRLASYFDRERVTQIDLRGADVDHMMFLHGFPHLRAFNFQGLLTATDLEDLLALPELTVLGIDADLPKTLPDTSSARVSQLTLTTSAFPAWLDACQRLFPALDRVRLLPRRRSVLDLAPLVGLPRLTEVVVHASHTVLNADRLPHARVTVL